MGKPGPSVPTWVGVQRAAEASGCVQPAILRGALVGDIRYKLQPGKGPLFALEDARQLILPRKGPPATS
jgi:hypothetical protein